MSGQSPSKTRPIRSLRAFALGSRPEERDTPPPVTLLTGEVLVAPPTSMVRPSQRTPGIGIGPSHLARSVTQRIGAIGSERKRETPQPTRRPTLSSTQL